MEKEASYHSVIEGLGSTRPYLAAIQKPQADSAVSCA